MTTCDATPNKSYSKEWQKLFGGKYYADKLRYASLKGSLRNSHFRSVCWKVFLRNLPEDHDFWIDAVKSQRQQYEKVLDKFQTNPRTYTENMDVSLNNPLSQSKQSPWNQYFKDSELRLAIEQDVVRTFPEIEFFRVPEIQNMMINILFSYAREFPHISYKQGMHELLAPLIFVLHHDQQAYLDASKTEDLNLEIHILLNQNYTEHDAFFLFSQLMKVVESWYTTDSPFTKDASLMDEIKTESFAETLESDDSLDVKLQRIYQHLLKHYDPEVFSFLAMKEIAPQIYGIRWLRLLFGREFSIYDLLVIWDAIFADSVAFDLVDYIFVAMLISIRDLLLRSDYTSCLNYLMRYPKVTEVQYILDLALHLRDPRSNPMPSKASTESKSGFFASAKNITPGHTKLTKTTNLRNKAFEKRPNSLKIIRTGSLSVPTASIVSETRQKSASLSEKTTKQINVSDCESSGFTHIKSKPTGHSFPYATIQNVMENDHKFKADDLCQNFEAFEDDKVLNNMADRELVTLSHSFVSQVPFYDLDSVEEKNEDGVKSLQHEISQMKLVNDYCADQITKHLETLQNIIQKQDLSIKNEMAGTLVGLTKVCDILKGTVSFSQVAFDSDNMSKKSGKSVLENEQTCEKSQADAFDDFVIIKDVCVQNISLTGLSEPNIDVTLKEKDTSENKREKLSSDETSSIDSETLDRETTQGEFMKFFQSLMPSRQNSINSLPKNT